MNDIQDIFKNQISAGAIDMFVYGIEHLDVNTSDTTIIKIHLYRGLLDAFPSNLEYLRMVEDCPIFKLVSNQEGE